MNRHRGNLMIACIAAACFAAGAISSLAQGRGPGGPPPGGGGGGGQGGGMNGGGPPPFGGQGPGSNGPANNGPGGPPPPRGNQSPGGGQASESPMRAGLQFGPPGQKWWDDKSFAKNLKLRPEQQSRMDSIFEQNRNALLSHLQTLQQAESQMEEVSRSPSPDETALFAQIDRVAQARADLEKANTHMLLQLRKEMDADQINRLEKHR